MSDQALAPPNHSLTPREFQQVRNLVYETSGLDIRTGKEGLVSARLGKKIRETRAGSFREYFQGVMDDRTGRSLAEMIDALTTNFTSFFREPVHFEFLRNTIIPQLDPPGKLRIWSAGCASGEEPYSIACSLKEAFGGLDRHRGSILASDISIRSLEKARKATYPVDSLRNLAPDRLSQWVLRGMGQSSGWYRMKDDVRAAVTFDRINLMEPPSNLGLFTVIFCRNVMIYFDKPTQAGVVRRFAQHLEPGGYLFIGHSESLNGIDHPLEYVKPAIYRNPRGGPGGHRRRTK